LYVGTALTATSIAITAQVLQQFGLIRRKVGQVVIAAAVIDDVLALFLLAVAHGLLSGALAPTGIASSILLAALALAVIFALCRLFAHGAAGWLFGSHPVFSLVFVVLVILMFGWVTQQLGYSLVVGGFFAGLGLAGGLKQTTREQLHRHIEKLVLVLSPFFFVLIGSRAEWGVLGDPGMVILLIGLLVVALVGKTLGGVLGAVGTRDIASRLLIGVGMAPRGEVALVIATLGFQQGHISHHVLVALILMTIGAALLAPVLMIPLARYQQQAAN
jgi:Kef-type K+ transport system membrane component KefB